MASDGGGGLSLADACDYVAAEDFSGGQTCSPCSCQTSAPTDLPSTAMPTSEPTSEPTPNPTDLPTNLPSTAIPTSEPTSEPTPNPTDLPTNSPSTAMPTPLPTSKPTPNPTPIPSRSPTREPTHCGCKTCTQEVWNAPAVNPSNPAENYSCGSRISWMASDGGGGLSLADACDYVAAEDFLGGQTCSPCSCQTSVPTDLPSTAMPTPLPTSLPSSKPTPNPTPIPSRSPTREPTYCGCEACTQEVWNTPAVNP